MREYIFVDKRRLDSYVDQIRSPLTADKLPEWSVGLSLAGPKAGGSQKQVTRPLASHEKVEELLTHLRKHKWVTTGSPSTSHGIHTSPTFRIDTVTATRVFLPPTESARTDFNGLHIWFAHYDAKEAPGRNSDENGKLFLLEDISEPDSSPHHFVSAFSELLLLTGIHEPQLELCDAGHKLMVSSAETQFASNPVGELLRLGAVPVLERDITVLYRIRTCTDTSDGTTKPFVESTEFVPSGFMTVGYPIVICEGSVDL